MLLLLLLLLLVLVVGVGVMPTMMVMMVDDGWAAVGWAGAGVEACSNSNGSPPVTRYSVVLVSGLGDSRHHSMETYRAALGGSRVDDGKEGSRRRQELE